MRNRVVLYLLRRLLGILWTGEWLFSRAEMPVREWHFQLEKKVSREEGL
jgi:hypothetical protein